MITRSSSLKFDNNYVFCVSFVDFVQYYLVLNGGEEMAKLGFSRNSYNYRQDFSFSCFHFSDAKSSRELSFCHLTSYHE